MAKTTTSKKSGSTSKNSSGGTKDPKAKGSKAKGSKAKPSTADARLTAPLAPVLQPGAGYSIGDVDADATPGWNGDRSAAEALTTTLGEELSELQERLFAEGRSGGTRSVLLVLQGLDTSGKGGIVRHVLGMVDPQGVTIRSFGVPTQEEREHPYLWRIRNALPAAGRIGVFDRSHYEDVLVVKVDELVDAEEIERRYDELVAFERELVDAGTTVVKVALVISPSEQYARLRERLERPDKQWKFSMGDLETRAKWPLYTEAYDRVLERTSSEYAPWHVVPANRKWYTRLVVTQLLVDALRGLDLGWPVVTFDPAAALEVLDATKDDPTALSVAEVEARAAAVEGGEESVS
ncbi:PPK2 family polyphosphate--nucleotide phosphotransferase [Serinibacter arcticus]|uniref:PPK2 family polyphosphate--nucleotide phosphotransferase n=1 Tax=Serinibacter arcticus TaxID=1655435 RepID=A0A2U1ZYJ2_9MICO|nr:PPK2 family polyphosphate kinase [Serinibacter arcticus]PWD52010.1 PPK2 family polyphosphate--nucleotide phosphotransferase [Serinibacter arcticus]